MDLEWEAERPTTNDFFFKTIVCKEDADNDKTWHPYIYRNLICFECNIDTGFRRKLWFGLFGPSGCIICKSCTKRGSNKPE